MRYDASVREQSDVIAGQSETVWALRSISPTSSHYHHPKVMCADRALCQTQTWKRSSGRTSAARCRKGKRAFSNKTQQSHCFWAMPTV